MRWSDEKRVKPVDLKRPTSWEARRVVVADKVWHIPEYYDAYEAFTFPGWEDALFFGRRGPIIVEYCSGNGTWILEKAQHNPDHNWVAVEKRFDRVRKIWTKMRNRKLHNVCIVSGEAHLATQHYFPTSSISEVFINFPDPWPKTRHHKHRLMQIPFLHELARILRPGGGITFVTDDPDYSQWTIEQFAKHPKFCFLDPFPYFCTELEGYGISFFEELWRSKGLMIRYHRIQRV